MDAHSVQWCAYGAYCDHTHSKFSFPSRKSNLLLRLSDLCESSWCMINSLTRELNTAVFTYPCHLFYEAISRGIEWIVSKTKCYSSAISQFDLFSIFCIRNYDKRICLSHKQTLQILYHECRSLFEFVAKLRRQMWFWLTEKKSDTFYVTVNQFERLSHHPEIPISSWHRVGVLYVNMYGATEMRQTGSE